MFKTMMADRKRVILWLMTLYVAFVFIQSLFFKFAGAPETIHIFSTLDAWAEDISGVSGLFAPGGIFSARVVGSVELLASVLMLAGMVLGNSKLHGVGALVGLAVISGAIFFHLFTPLGIVIVNEELGVASDGGTLFIMASGVWIFCAAIVILRRDALLVLKDRGR